MKSAIFIFGILGSLLLAAGGVVYSSNKVASIWIFFAAVVVYAFTGALYCHDLNVTAPTLARPKFSEKIDGVSFSFGERGMTFVYSRSTLKEPVEPCVFNNFKPVKLYLDGEDLYADVNVYGGSGLPPIEIRHGELRNKPINWDCNSNEKAIEVVDEDGNPMYQLYYKNSSHIVVNGIFPDPEGVVLIDDKGILGNPSQPVWLKLNRIFKYPSWKYPGIFEE